MADESKTIIYGIELDLGELTAKALEAKKSIDSLKKEQKELATAGKGASLEFEANRSKLTQLNNTYKEATKQIDATNKARTAEKGSNIEMRAQLEINTIKWNNLSEAEKNNSEVGGKLQAETKHLSDELKKNESAIGDNRRNVGNYAEAMKSLPGPLGEAGQGVEGLRSTFNKLLANPILLAIAAIIIALKGLHAAFTSTDSGALEFDVRVNQVKSTLDVAKERAFSFGRAIIDLFKGDNESAAKNFSDALGVTGRSFSAAAAEARRYTEAIDEIEDTEKAYIAHAAENANKIARLKVEAADKGNSNEQRIVAIKQAIALEKEEADERVKIAKAGLANELAALQVKTGINHKDLQSFVALTEDRRKLASAELQRKYNDNHEEFEKLTEKYTKFVEADTSYYENIKKLKGQETATQEQIDAEVKQKHDKSVADYEKTEQKKFEATQKRLKDEKYAIETQVLGSIKLSEGELNNKIALLEKEKEIELSQKGLTNNQKLFIEMQYTDRVKQLGLDHIKDLEDQAKKELELQLSTVNDKAERERLLAAADALNKKQSLDELHNEGLIDEQQYQKELQQLNFDTQQKNIQLKIDELTKKIELEADGTNKELELKNQLSQAKQQLVTNDAEHERGELKKTEQARKAAANASLSLAANTFGNIAGLLDQQSEAYKAFATAQVIAQSIQAVMNAYSSASAVPIVGPVLGPLAAIAAGAFGALQVAKINGVEFYEGGYTTEGNPRERATNLGSRPFTYHKSEYIVPAKVLHTDLGSRLVANLEAMRRCSPMTLGVGGFADGGFSSRYVSAPIDGGLNRGDIQNAMMEAVKQMPPPIVDVKDIISQVNDYNKVQARAEL